MSPVCNIDALQQPQEPRQDHEQQQQQQNQQQPQQSGLDHLVEAATALTQLVRTANVPKADDQQQQQQQQLNSHQISDDEESKSKHVSSKSDSSAATATSTTTTSTPSMVVTQVQVSSSPPSSSSPPLKLPGETIKEIFPRRLHRILADPTISDIITWLPQGHAFVILRTDELAESVLPRYFPESCASAQAQASNKGHTSANSNTTTKPQACKYPSFTRKLNRWGFRQITRGQDSGAFQHKFFHREEPDLCLKMVCQRSRRRKAGKGNGVTMDDIRMRPTAQVLGPYSAVLRQPVADCGNASSVGVNLAAVTGAGAARKHPSSSITDCDSDTSMNNITVGGVALKPKTQMQSILYPKKDEDQATIVSSRSCNTPPPNLNQRGTSVSSLLSPAVGAATTTATATHTGVSNVNTSPIIGGGMSRSVSNCSTAQTNSNTMNINMSFPIFTTNANAAPQIDPRLLLQHNMATTANAASAAVTLNQAIASAGLPQMQQQQQQQQPVMPSFITLLDPKTTLNQQQQQQHSHHHSHSHTQLQLQPKQTVAAAPVPPAVQVQVPAPSPFAGQLLPVGAPVATSIAASAVASSPSTLTTNSSNSTICSSNSNSSGMTVVSQQQQQQQQQQQTEAQMRVANAAKNMLYTAFLQALG